MIALRFVILRHDCPRGLHWDFMLEADGVLRTWALDAEPVGRLTCGAEPLADHRLAYLDYEGEVSEGRGTVARFDSGTYRLRRDDAEGLIVELRGARLRGEATLLRESGDQRWRFSFEPDGTAASGFAEGSDAGEPSESRSTV
ncbi:MAG: DNA polymerase ligase N-terminal domain-containing protein [Pirellulales bacterium]